MARSAVAKDRASDDDDDDDDDANDDDDDDGYNDNDDTVCVEMHGSQGLCI